MAESRASAVWEGNLAEGRGRVSAASGVFTDLEVTWMARTVRPDPGTSPEELIAAAHAACYSMACSHALAEAGHPAEQVAVTAVCHFTHVEGGGFSVSRTDLDVHARVKGSTRPGSSSTPRTASAAARSRMRSAATSRSPSPPRSTPRVTTKLES
jgi:lipoyl-dependent peroxiredoxin